MAYTPDEVALAIIEEGQTARTDGTPETQHGVITPKGIQIALSTAIVESNDQVLANPNVPESENYPNDGDGYDHASAGEFQQQYMWWGTVAEEMDPRLSAAMFYHHLEALPEDYNSDAQSPGSYAQDVQGSAFPDRYDQHWQEAVDQYNRLVGQANGAPPPPPAPAPPFVETDLTQNNENDEDRQGQAPRLIVLHTEEGGMQGENFEVWMANNGVSYHKIVNPDGSVIDMETDDVGSWSVLSPGNEFSLNLVFATSTIHWSRQEWLDNMGAGIKSAAYLAAQWCREWNIPPVILVGPNYPKCINGSGITDHYSFTYNKYPGSTHIDVGPNFPWDVFNIYLQQFVNGAPQPAPAPQGVFMALTDDEQTELLSKTRSIYAALFNLHESKSIYRDPHNADGSVPASDLWADKDLIQNDDKFDHEEHVERTAKEGDPDSLRRLALVAAGKGADTSAAAVARAKAALEAVPADILAAYQKAEEAGSTTTAAS